MVVFCVYFIFDFFYFNFSFHLFYFRIFFCSLVLVWYGALSIWLCVWSYVTYAVSATNYTHNNARIWITDRRISNNKEKNWTI